jgi:hypothetical protein
LIRHTALLLHWVLWASLFAGTSALAQNGPGFLVVTGKVIAGDGSPIAGAELRLASGDSIVWVGRSGGDGSYHAEAARWRGPFVLRARAFGYAPLTVMVVPDSSGQRAVRDLRLNPVRLTLDTLRAVTRRRDPGSGPIGPETPAEQSTHLPTFLSEAYPVDPSSPEEVAALHHGVVRGGAAGTELSIAGQAASQNSATLDGAGGGGRVPLEGVRSVSVVSSSYDVSRGLFSGGLLATTTIAGSEEWGGAFSAQLDESALRFGVPRVARQQGRRMRYSLGGGGPLRAGQFFVYGSADLHSADDRTISLASANAAALLRAGLSPDSAAKFLAILIGLGVPISSSQDETMESATGLLRLDFDAGHGHRLTARLNGRRSDPSTARSVLRLPAPVVPDESREAGLFLQHEFRGAAWAGEVRASISSSRWGGGHGGAVPMGTVRVDSRTDGVSLGLVDIAFGGERAAPRTRHEHAELGQEVGVALGSRHLVKAGYLLREERLEAESIVDPGWFRFASLDDLAAGRPARFTRVISGPSSALSRRSAGMYLADLWHVGPRTGIIAGVRLDHVRPTGPNPSDPSGALAGVRLGMPPATVVSPRVGVTAGLAGSGHWTLAGGAGLFVGIPSLAMVRGAWGQAGDQELRLDCLDLAAPVPNWTGYAADPGSIPAACRSAEGASADSMRRRIVFRDDVTMPRTLRGSVSISGRLTPRTSAWMEAVILRGSGLARMRRPGLRVEPTFYLEHEAGRPVFVSQELIAPATGQMASGAGYAGADLTEVASDGTSATVQVTVRINGLVGRSTLYSAAYTGTHARARAAGFGGDGVSPTTAGDPRNSEWSPAPFAPRHQFQLLLSGAIRRRIRMSLFGRFSSGIPYTPMVADDINGDGLPNDRAFVFPPNAISDSVVATDMVRLLEGAPSHAARCLRHWLGRIPAAGACRTGWNPSLDARAEYVIGRPAARRLTLSFTAANLTAGLDHLLHGADGVRGWGQYAAPEATLLSVRAFDPSRAAFVYHVNPRFGRPIGGDALRQPMRITLQARVTLGADPRYQPLDRAVRQGRTASHRAARNAVAFRLTNVPAAVLRLDAGDTTALALTGEQRARLAALADSLSVSMSDATERLYAALTAGRGTPAQWSAEDAAEEAIRLDQAARGRVQSVLSRAQWDRLPAWLRRPAVLADLIRPVEFTNSP